MLARHISLKSSNAAMNRLLVFRSRSISLMTDSASSGKSLSDAGVHILDPFVGTAGDHVFEAEHAWADWDGSLVEVELQANLTP